MRQSTLRKKKRGNKKALNVYLSTWQVGNICILNCIVNFFYATHTHMGKKNTHTHTHPSENVAPKCMQCKKMQKTETEKRNCEQKNVKKCWTKQSEQVLLCGCVLELCVCVCVCWAVDDDCDDKESENDDDNVCTVFIWMTKSQVGHHSSTCIYI